jgi:hypothetical protein
MMSADFKKKSKNKNKLSIKIPKRKVFRTTEPLIAIFMWGVNYTVCLLYLFFINKYFILILNYYIA